MGNEWSFLKYLNLCFAASPLEDILTKYETLDQAQFHHTPVKRSADTEKPTVRHVQFDSQGR